MPQVQLSSGVDRELWLASEGHAYENTLASMEAANWVLTKAIERCGRSEYRENRLFFFYAKGHCPSGFVNTTFHYDREAWYRKKLAQLRALRQKAQSASPAPGVLE